MTSVYRQLTVSKHSAGNVPDSTVYGLMINGESASIGAKATLLMLKSLITIE